MENAKEERGIEMVIAREGGCMKVKNEAQKEAESEMDGLFSLPCELICSNASLPDKYSYTNASVI